MFTRENEETPFELEVLCFQTKPHATRPDGWVSWGIRYCTGVNQWPGSWSSWGKSLPWLFQVDWELEEIWACSCWLKDLKRSDSWDHYWPKVILHLLTGEWVKAFRDLEISFTTYLAALLHSISFYIVVHVLLQTNFFPTVALWSFDPPLKTPQKHTTWKIERDEAPKVIELFLVSFAFVAFEITMGLGRREFPSFLRDFEAMESAGASPKPNETVYFYSYWFTAIESTDNVTSVIYPQSFLACLVPDALRISRG